MSQQITVDNNYVRIPCDFAPGIYYIRIANSIGILCQTKIYKN